MPHRPSCRTIFLSTLLALAACGDSGGDEGAEGAGTSTSDDSTSSSGSSTGTTGQVDASSGATASTGSDTGPSTDASSGTGNVGGPCVIATMTSDLPGVEIHVTAPTCTFTVAEAQAGIIIDYELVIADPLEAVFPDEYGSANCVELGPENLLVSERLTGGGHAYCECDKGLCPPWDPPDTTLAPGTYPFGFDWEGHNWNGPSDTPTPYGEPFPPGTYILELRAVGQWDEPGVGLREFEVLTEAEIVLFP